MKKFRPSNGSMGESFMADFCDQCKRDRAFQLDPENNDGCPIVAKTMALQVDDPDYPAEWVEHEDGSAECTAFEPVTS